MRRYDNALVQRYLFSNQSIIVKGASEIVRAFRLRQGYPENGDIKYGIDMHNEARNGLS